MTDRLPRVIRTRYSDPGARACLRVLGTLAELHKAGYQRLRGMPFISPSGMYWRLWIAPTDFFYRNNGALVVEEDGHDILARGGGAGRRCAAFSTGRVGPGHYFGWHDTVGDDARGLVAKLVERKRDLAVAGVGWDYAYAGWWQRLLGLAERGWLPVALADDPFRVRSDRIHLDDIRSEECRAREAGQAEPVLPMPPPGGSAHQWEHFDQTDEDRA